ncbi:MAG: O-antigen ligase family protein [Gallionella sp.]|nr:O-antigen ligase family protein [Gallionella sp.]
MRNKILFLIAACVGVAYLIHTAGNVQTSTLVVIIVFFVTLGISFVRGVDALYIIVFAMLFSPEIGTSLTTGKVAGGEGAGAITLRLEDILLVAVGCGWLLRTAYDKRQFGIVRTGVNTAIGVYIAACVVATLLGVIGGTVNLMTGVVHNLKFFEYFFLFFMILAHVRSKKIITKMLIAMIVVFSLAMIFGYTQIELTGIKRVVAPFDSGESNTFGGYIVLLMCVIFGIVLADPRTRVRVPLILLLLFALPPFLFTLSRASYMAFIAGCLAFLAVSQQRIVVGAIIIVMVAIPLIGVTILPVKVQNRITGTFQADPEFHEKIGNIDLDSSASARIVSYQQALEIWEKSPLFGHGVTGTHFIDGQYFRLLAETGIIGLAAFLFVLWRLLGEVREVYKHCEDYFLKGAALGLFCGIIAMMVHAISANSFIIIRIAEPLWLMAGLILLIPRLGDAEETTVPAAIQPLA